MTLLSPPTFVLHGRSGPSSLWTGPLEGGSWGLSPAEDVNRENMLKREADLVLVGATEHFPCGNLSFFEATTEGDSLEPDLEVRTSERSA